MVGAVGALLGSGSVVGPAVGALLGVAVGSALGAMVGSALGAVVGSADGEGLGDGLGACVHWSPTQAMVKLRYQMPP